MRKIIIGLTIGMLPLIYACGNQIAYDTIVKNVPRDYDNRDSSARNYISLASQALNLENLEEGFNPIQIRIWLSFGLNDTNQLITLRKGPDSWQGNFFTFSNDGIKRSSKKVNAAVSDISPRSGWKAFISEIIANKILELPDMSSLNNNNFVISEGDVATIEIATKNHYRLYTYISPKDFRDKWWQANNMEKILQLLEYEFNFKRLR